MGSKFLLHTLVRLKSYLSYFLFSFLFQYKRKILVPQHNHSRAKQCFFFDLHPAKISQAKSAVLTAHSEINKLTNKYIHNNNNNNNHIHRTSREMKEIIAQGNSNSSIIYQQRNKTNRTTNNNAANTHTQTQTRTRKNNNQQQEQVHSSKRNRRIQLFCTGEESGM